MLPLVVIAGRANVGKSTLFNRLAGRRAALVADTPGVTPADAHFATWIRRQGRPVLLVANKAEGRGGGAAALEAFALGLGEPLAVSAEHGEGIADLMREIAERLPDPPD